VISARNVQEHHHGSDMYISGARDSRWNNDELNPAFRSLTARRLRGRAARLALAKKI
jgi:hypothetical protein